jgi:hypothetical protein
MEAKAVKREFIRIIQIFINANLKSGDIGLRTLIDVHNYPSPERGEVYLFINRKRNLIKALGNRGIFVDRLSGKQTYDLSLRKDSLLEAIGVAFGISFDVNDNTYKKAKELLKR